MYGGGGGGGEGEGEGRLPPSQSLPVIITSITQKFNFIFSQAQLSLRIPQFSSFAWKGAHLPAPTYYYGQ